MTKFSTQRDLNPMALGSNAKEHTVGATDLPFGAKAVVFDVTGTCDGLNMDGTAFAGFPVVAGNPLAFVPQRVTAVAGPTKCFVIT